MQSCSINGCVSPVYSFGWCRCHYERWRRHGDPHQKKKKKDGLEYLASRSKPTCVHPNLPDVCCEWTRSKCKGYGNAYWDGKHCFAHVLSAKLHLGFDSDCGLLVLHKCDNRACINPNHLFFGTAKDNHTDMISKGRARFARGERINTTRLIKEQVIVIKKRIVAGDRICDIARDYGVHETTIGKIACGKNWSWL